MITNRHGCFYGNGNETIDLQIHNIVVIDTTRTQCITFKVLYVNNRCKKYTTIMHKDISNELSGGLVRGRAK